MKRHSIKWESLAFGAFFLAIAGNWVAWKQDALSLEQFAVTAPIALIVIGIIGITVSIWRKK